MENKEKRRNNLSDSKKTEGNVPATTFKKTGKKKSSDENIRVHNEHGEGKPVSHIVQNSKKRISVRKKGHVKAKKQTPTLKGDIRALKAWIIFCFRKTVSFIDYLLVPHTKKEGFLTIALLFSLAGWNATLAVKKWPGSQQTIETSEADNTVQQKEEKPQINVLTDEEWYSMTTELESQSKKWPSQVGIVIKDLETGRVWQKNTDMQFRSASLIKVPIAAALMERIGGGEISLDSSLKVSSKNRISGSGSLKWAKNGTEIPLKDVLFKMITESDNTATKMIVDEIGLNSIAESLGQLGLENTNVCKNISNMTSAKIKDDSYTTPQDIAGLFERIYSGSLVDKEKSNYLLEILKQTKSRNRLKAYLPDGWGLGHKTGLLRMACHDAGIVFSPRGNYLLVVMTGNVPNYKRAKAFIAGIGRTTYRYYMSHQASQPVING